MSDTFYAQNGQLGIYPLDDFTGTDDQKMTAALTALFAAGGGTIQLSPRAHAFASQWATAYNPGVSTNLRISGAGASPHGQSEGVQSGCTKAAMTYAGSGAARMDFQHSGSVEIDHILFTDGTGSTVPFFQTTNAQPYLHDLGFTGDHTAQSCTQDAIYMGGLGTGAPSSGDTAPFQAYQGVAERCSFWGIRTAIWCRTFANAISMRDILVDGSCGSPNVLAVTDGAMTAASAVLTCATSAPFTSGMVGQVILVAGAGQANRNSWLIATISAFTSSSQVTLNCAATQTVTGASVTAPQAAAIQVGTGTANQSQGGNVLDDSLIEVSNYAIGILFSASSFNAITGTSLWDGIAGTSLCGVGSAGNGHGNYVHLTACGVGTGGASFLTDLAGNSYGQDTLIVAGGPNPVIQLPSVTTSGNEPVSIFGVGGSTANALAFGPAGGPADGWIYRNGSGALNLLPPSGQNILMLGPTNNTNLLVGTTNNDVQIGPAGTGDVYWVPGGSAATVNSRFRAKGTGSFVDLQAHIVSALSGTPAIAAGAGAGTSPTVSVAGNDNRGLITITTGTSPAAGVLATITFAATWAALGTPFIVVSGDSAAASGLMPGTAARSATTFELVCNQAPSASTTYTFVYQAIG